MTVQPCIYCHYPEVAEGSCPKCGAPSSDKRKINFIKVDGKTKEQKDPKELSKIEPLETRPKRASKPMKFIWMAIVGFLILGLVSNQNQGGKIGLQKPAHSAADLKIKPHTSKIFTLPENNPDQIQYDSGVEPILVGKNAKMVLGRLGDFGLYGEFVNQAGESIPDLLGKKVTGRGSWDDFLGPYFICDQLPIAGVPITDMTDHVTLTVSTRCKSQQPSYLAGKYAAKYRMWGPRIPKHPGTGLDTLFEGWVVSVGLTGFLETLQVKIRTPYEIQTVEFKGLTSASNPCISSTYIEKIWNAGLNEARSELAVNTPVQFKTDGGGNDVAIWKLSFSRIQSFVPAGTPTVNESLAAGGYFEPTNGYLTTNSALDSGARWKLDFPDDSTTLEKRLVRAANLAIANGAGPVNLCKSK